MTRRRRVIASVAAAVVVVGGAVVWQRLATGGEVTAVGVDDALERFRESVTTIASLPTTSDPATTVVGAASTSDPAKAPPITGWP